MPGGGILSLYHRLPTLAQHLAVTLQGVQVQQQRYRGAFAATRRFLVDTERLSSSEVAELQGRELRRVVLQAATKTVYYSELFEKAKLDPLEIQTAEDLHRIPLLEKKVLRDRARDFHASTGSRRRVYHTSGTTGTPLAIPIDDRSRQRNYAFFCRALSWAGVENGRSATFAGRPLIPAWVSTPRVVWRANPAMRNRLFSSYHLGPANALAYSRALCSYRPDFIDGYPSAVSTLAALFEEARLPVPRLRAIITSSETLTVGQRERIERVFGTTCFDLYASTEQAVFVSQCEAGSYHVHPEYGIVELLRSDGRQAAPGEQGEIVCTSFTNDALPLIRYRIGDLAIAGEPGCRCGRFFPTIAAIIGRGDDVLVTPDGRHIGRLDPVFKGLVTIREAQICQESERRIQVRVVPGPGYTSNDGDVLRRELQARLGAAMEIGITEVDSIERSSSGKFLAVVNRLSRDSGRQPVQRRE